MDDKELKQLLNDFIFLMIVVGESKDTLHPSSTDNETVYLSVPPTGALCSLTRNLTKSDYYLITYRESSDTEIIFSIAVTLSYNEFEVLYQVGDMKYVLSILKEVVESLYPSLNIGRGA